MKHIKYKKYFSSFIKFKAALHTFIGRKNRNNYYKKMHPSNQNPLGARQGTNNVGAGSSPSRPAQPSKTKPISFLERFRAQNQQTGKNLPFGSSSRSGGAIGNNSGGQHQGDVDPPFVSPRSQAQPE